tara:strand:+ start:997 stop:1557 length:561 start_codon:yes stop_codon:yes gene_type:complete
MYKLFTDKAEIFECDVKVEGTSLSKSKARLVIETKDYSLLFKGEINSKGKCKIPVKKLKGLIDESSNGNIRLEVIAEDTFFTPWESNFEVQASKKVTVEVKSQEEKPLITENKVKVLNIKNEITESEKKHIINILKLLIRENINIKNLHLEKNKVNNIIATYIKSQPIKESLAPKIIDGIIQGLTK